MAIEQPQKTNSHIVTKKEQQKKLVILVALAFLVLVLGWVGTMQWNYGENGVHSADLFKRIGDSAAKPGAETLKEGSNALKSQ